MSSPGQKLLFRLARAVVTLWLVVTVVFVILRLSGDPAALLLPEDATPEQIESLRRHLGLDQPIPVQYGKYWLNLAQGDLGDSLRFNQPATGLVIERLPATARLALAAFLLSTAFGLSVGIVTALLRGSFWDRAVMTLMSVLQSSPSFFLGIILILVFTVKLGWLPSSGAGSARQLILPAVTLSALSLASLARLTRSTLLDVLRADYIRTARAKGMTERVVVLRHALRNASLPVVTVLGLELAGLLTGTVIVEIVFAWPGVGRLAVQSVSFRDYPVVQATVLLITAIFVLVNLLVDLSYFFLDPRVRHD
jgi:ABC-type dipeptide/oligopeptide/nickel transport system permease component